MMPTHMQDRRFKVYLQELLLRDPSHHFPGFQAFGPSKLGLHSALSSSRVRDVEQPDEKTSKLSNVAKIDES